MLVLKSFGGSFEEAFGRLITFSRFTKDFTCTVLGSPNNQMTPQTKKAPMGTHLATVVSMRMNRIQRTITNTYNMGYVLDLTCQYLG